MVAAKIKIEHLFQVYGKHPAAACSMLAAGKSRQEIFQTTGIDVYKRQESSLDGILRAIASKPEAQKERFFAAVRVLVKGIDEL